MLFRSSLQVSQSVVKIEVLGTPTIMGSFKDYLEVLGQIKGICIGSKGVNFWEGQFFYSLYKSMQILSTRSKVSLRRFYESFISNQQCKSYVCDINME